MYHHLPIKSTFLLVVQNKHQNLGVYLSQVWSTKCCHVSSTSGIHPVSPNDSLECREVAEVQICGVTHTNLFPHKERRQRCVLTIGRVLAFWEAVPKMDLAGFTSAQTTTKSRQAWLCHLGRAIRLGPECSIRERSSSSSPTLPALHVGWGGCLEDISH